MIREDFFESFDETVDEKNDDRENNDTHDEQRGIVRYGEHPFSLTVSMWPGQKRHALGPEFSGIYAFSAGFSA